MKKNVLMLTMVSLLLLLLVAGFVAAGELLTLRGAAEKAALNNPRAGLASIGVDKAGLEYQITDGTANMYRQLLGSGGPVEGEEAMMQFLLIDTVKAETNKAVAERQQAFTDNQLAYEALESYFRLYQAHEQLNLMKLSLERARDLKRIAEAGLSAGTMAKSEVMRAEAHVATMEATLLGAENNKEIAEAALNMTLGRDILTPVDLVSALNLPEVGEVDLQGGTSRALGLNPDIVRARAGVDIANAAKEYVKYLFGTGNDQYTVAELGVQEAILALQLTEERVRLEVYSLYQTLTGREKQLAARQKALDLAAENYRLSKLRYELGVATQGEVTDAMLALSEQEITLLSEKIRHYTDYLNWRLKTGLPVNY